MKIDFTDDLFALRRSNTGSGNPYDPDSLLTGAEIEQGLDYGNSRRYFANAEGRDKILSGNASTDEVLALAPRRLIAQGI